MTKMYDNEIYGYKNKNKISYSDAIAINELKKMRNDKKKDMKRELQELILTRVNYPHLTSSAFEAGACKSSD